MTVVLRARIVVILALAACGKFGVDKRDEHGMTALMIAARAGSRDDVERLIDRGANVNAAVPTRDLRELIAFVSWMQQLPESDVGYTPLHYAVMGGNPEIVRLLLARGAKAFVAARGGMTPMDLAVLRSNVPMLDMLARAGARPSARQLHLAIAQSTPVTVRALLSHGADPNERIPPAARSAAPSPPPMIIAATMRGDTEIVRALLDAGADIDARDRNGWTAVRWAQQQGGGGSRRGPGDRAAVAVLLQGAGASDEGGAKADALFHAIYAKDEAAVRAALRAGANANARDARGVVALVSAARLGLAAAVAALVDAGANVNASAEYDTTPLIAAIEGGSVDAVRKLIEAGARVNQADRFHVTPLEAAGRAKHTEITQLLLASSATLDPAALATAALSGNLEQVRLLLAKGADPNAGGKGHTLNEAVRGCTRHDNTEVVRALLDAGADPRQHGDDNYTPLHRANLCPPAVTRLLLEHGADVNASSINGWTAIMGAAFDGNIEIVRMLIAAGANVNARDDAGKTVLQYAQQHPIVQEELRRAGAQP